MPEAVSPEKIIESVSVANLKTLGESTSFLTHLSNQNAVSHQQGINAVLTAGVARAVEKILSTSPTEGGIDVAGLQQLMKGAQSTPPVS